MHELNYWYNYCSSKKGKVFPYSLTSIGLGADPGVQAVSQQVTFQVIHYFPPDLRSPSQPKNVTVLRPVPSYTAWWEHIGVNDLRKVVMQFCPTTYWLQVQCFTTMPLYQLYCSGIVDKNRYFCYTITEPHHIWQSDFDENVYIYALAENHCCQ